MVERREINRNEIRVTRVKPDESRWQASLRKPALPRIFDLVKRGSSRTVSVCLEAEKANPSQVQTYEERFGKDYSELYFV